MAKLNKINRFQWIFEKKAASVLQAFKKCSLHIYPQKLRSNAGK